MAAALEAADAATPAGRRDKPREGMRSLNGDRHSPLLINARAERSTSASSAQGAALAQKLQGHTSSSRVFRLRYVLSSVVSVALGAASLGSSWRTAVGALGAPSVMADVLEPGLAILSACFLALFIAKAIVHPEALVKDLKDPRPLGALVSSGTMAVMVDGAVLAKHADGNAIAFDAGVTIWRIGLWLHLLLLVSYSVQRVAQYRAGVREWRALTPAIFVVYVGTAAGAASAGTALSPTVATWEVDLSLWMGIGCLVPLLPLMSLRVQQLHPIGGPLMSDCSRPTLAVMMAPCSLCLTAWLATGRAGDEPTAHFITITLFVLAAITAAYVYAHGWILLFRLKPSPGWASYTFPLDIVSIAMMRFSALHPDSIVLRLAAWVAFVAANAVVWFTILCFIKWFVTGDLLVPYPLYNEYQEEYRAGTPLPLFVLRPDAWTSAQAVLGDDDGSGGKGTSRLSAEGDGSDGASNGGGGANVGTTSPTGPEARSEDRIAPLSFANANATRGVPGSRRGKSSASAARTGASAPSSP